MMTETRHTNALKIALKVIAWMFISVAALFLLVKLVLHLPFVQNGIISKAETAIENSGYLNAKIGEIDINFPTTLVVNDIGINNLAGDTALNLEHLAVKIKLLPLLQKKLVFENVVLVNGLGYIEKLLPETNNETPTQGQENTEENSSSWEIGVNSLSVDRCYFTYLDESPTGFNFILNLGKVRARLGTLDLEKLIHFSELETENTCVTYENLSSIETADDSLFSFADIRVDDISLIKSGFYYIDTIFGTTINVSTGELKTNDLLVDITREKVTIDKGAASDLLVEVLMKTLPDSLPDESNPLDWGQYLYRVEGNRLDLQNAAVKVENVDEPAPHGHFDTNHLELVNMCGRLADFVLGEDILQITMQDFSGMEANGLELKQLNTQMRMDGTDFVVEELEMETASAKYSASLRTDVSPTDYSNVASKKLDLVLNITAQNLNDIDFFYPLPEWEDLSAELVTSAYSLSLKTMGSTNRLNIDTFDFQLLDATQLQLAGQIKNLADTSNHVELDLKNIRVRTGQKDLQKVFSKMPEAVKRFPDFAQLTGSYRLYDGKHEFSAKLNSEAGRLTIRNAVLVPGDTAYYSTENFSVDLFHLDSLIDLDLSRIKLEGQATVSGSDLSNLFADVNLKVDTLGYRNHMYNDLNLTTNSRQGMLEASLVSLDPDAKLEACISGNFQNPLRKLSAQFNMQDLNLHALGYVPNDFRINTKTRLELAFSQSKYLDARCNIESLDFFMGDTVYNMHEADISLLSNDLKTRFTLKSFFYNLDFDAEDSYTGLARALALLPDYYLHENRADSIPFRIPAYKIQGKLDYPEDFISLLFPYLPSFKELNVSGKGTSNGEFYIDASLVDLEYNGVRSDSLTLDISGDEEFLRIRNTTDLQVGYVLAGKLNIESDVSNSKWNTRLQYIDSKGRTAFDIGGFAVAESDSILAFIAPENLVLNYQNWLLDPTQSLVFRKNVPKTNQGILAGQFSLRNAGQEISFGSSEKGWNLKIDTLNLQALSHILNDTLQIGGRLKLNLKTNPLQETEKLDLQISGLNVDSVQIEQLKILAERKDGFLNANLSAQNNSGDVALNLKGKNEKYDFKVRLNNLNLESLHQQLAARQSDILVGGRINGQLEGSYSEELRASGSLAFNDVNIEYIPYQLYLALDRDTVEFRDERVEFRDFNLYDRKKNKLTVNGELLLKSVPELDLRLTSEQFMVFDNDDEDLDVGGKLSIATDLKLTGNLQQTSLKGYLNTLPESFIRYKYSSNVMLDDMEKVLTFKNFDTDTVKSATKTKPIARHQHIDWDINMNIDNTEIYILLFETSHDYVRLFANGQLNLQKGLGDKLMLYGELSSNNGSVFYDAPMVSAIDLKIIQASAKWDGDIDNPVLNFKGYEIFRVAPGEVFNNWNTTGERVPVTVFALAENSTLNNFDIHFDVESEDGQLQKHFEGLMPATREGYATNLLVFGTLTGMKNSAGGSAMAKGVVAKLNEISRRNIRNADLSFYMDQSVNDENNLQSVKEVGYSFSKGMFGQRVRLSVGGDIKLNQNEVYDSRMKTFNPLGNLQLDYIISRKPDLSINAIRRDIYKGAIDGQITESSLGVTYRKTFPNLFKKARKEDE